jgi:phospho-N-acetylmuramoyl-pentapeptide-transferase
MLILLRHLSEFFGPFRLFGYVSARVILAALTSFVLMMIIMPPLIRWLRKKKFGESGSKRESEVVDAMREQKKGTPTMGGIGIVIAIALTAFLWCDPQSYRPWLLQFGMISFALVGYLDDRTKIFKGAKGTPSSVKLAIQISAATLCGFFLYGIGLHDFQTLLPQAHPAGYAPEYQKILPSADGGDHEYLVRLAVNQLSFPFVPVEHAINLGLFAVLWTVFVTTACANGVNFTDGMDGLAGGTMFIAALAFVVIAYLVSRVDTADYLKVLYVSDGEEVAVFMAAVAGACLGFLWFNAAPAEVFMGDTGSQALGGVLGLAALNTKQEFLILLVGLIFVVEAASVAIQTLVFKATKHRPGGGKRVFLCAPIHHHFQFKGWPESKIVMRFWIIAAMSALIALTTLKIR